MYIDIFVVFRNIPLSLVLGVPFVIVLYILTNIAYFAALDMDAFFNSGSVAYVSIVTVNEMTYRLITIKSFIEYIQLYINA